MSRDPDKIPGTAILNLERESMIHVTVVPVFLVADGVASYLNGHRASETHWPWNDVRLRTRVPTMILSASVDAIDHIRRIARLKLNT
jgi:hypothetical protein